MRPSKGPGFLALLGAIFTTLFLAAPGAHAAALLWTGGGATNNISDPGNWQTNVAPSSGDFLNFLLPAIQVTVNVDVANASYAGMFIDGPISITFQGNGMEIVQGLTMSSGSVVFDNDVHLGQNFSFALSSPSGVNVTFASSLATEGGTIGVIAPGGCTLDFGSNVTGSSTGLAVTATAIRAIDVYLRGTNSFSGDITLGSSVALHLGSLDSLGAGPGSLEFNGTLELDNPSSGEAVIARPLKVRGVLELSGSGPFRLAGGVTGEVGSIQASVPVTIAGISGNGLTIGPGSGRVDLQGSSWPGPLAVSGGTAHIASSLSPIVSVKNGGTLSLDGSSYTFADFTCDASGSVSVTLGATQIQTPGSGGCSFQLAIPPSLAIPSSGFIPIATYTGPSGGTFTSNPNFAEGSTVNVNGTTMQVTYHGTSLGNVLGLVLPPGSARPVTGLSAASRDVSIPRGTTRSNFITVAATSSTGPSANNQVTFSALGSCGSFGGAASATANTDVNGIAVAPAFTAPSGVTVCTVRASAPGQSAPITADISVHVYDAATAKLTFVPTSASVYLNQQFSVYAALTDASASFIAGEAIRFSGSSQCVQGLSPSADAVTNLAGVAVIQIRAGFIAQRCSIQAAHVGGTATASEDLLIYSTADVVGAASQSPIQTVVNQAFSFSIVFTANGIPLPGIDIHVNLPSSGATATLTQYVVTTDNAGSVTFSGSANGVVGDYSIGVDIPAHLQALLLQVHQVAATGTPPPSPPPPPPPPPSPTPSGAGDVQDMWWVGSAENGWGMSLIQHNDTLFAAFYIYDASGNPTWLVMPGGSWDSTHTIYAGSLYQPAGSPFYAYDTTHFVPGSAKGSVTLSFVDSDNAILDYTIGTASGHKAITREIFGADTIVGTDRTDLWWGGTSQNGWGMTIIQQGATLFPIWYTYDANGRPLWYVMPSGTWTSSTTYAGALYRTTGSPWIGAVYDPTKLQAFDVGAFNVTFNADGTATFNYTADGHSGTIPLVREPF